MALEGTAGDNLDKLIARPEATVIICEGAKCADAASRIFPEAVAIASLNGAKSAKQNDWTVLAGRMVIQWPDVREAGAKYVDEVAAILAGVPDTQVFRIDAEALAAIDPAHLLNGAVSRDPPAKFDSAFALEEGWDPERLRELALEHAKPVVASQCLAPAADDNDEHDSAQDAGRVSEFSDDALALIFADLHAHNLRFVAAWGRWLRWTGTHWEFDDTLNVWDLARRICRAAAVNCDPKTANSIRSGKTIAAVEKLARCDRRLAAKFDQFDADDWVLNTPGGTIDLKTGTMRPHCPQDYCTKIAGAAPGGDCPMFKAFLKKITAGDAELEKYIQRYFGYALTGKTGEHMLLFGYGTGRNGKGVLVTLMAGVLGAYHVTTPFETFAESHSDRHPTELADLRGARLVTATETEEGRKWSEAKIKALTGGDIIAARFMRQDFFRYAPKFKLFITGNHKPSLRSVDEAIRARFHLLPFTVFIPVEERDKNLSEKLKAEYPGILVWVIEGCLSWQRDGLKPPQVVLDATNAYLEAEDSFAQWIEERCELGADFWQSKRLLFSDWKNWCDRGGEFAGTEKKFVQKLETRFRPHKRNIGLGLLGLKLKPQEPEDCPRSYSEAGEGCRPAIRPARMPRTAGVLRSAGRRVYRAMCMKSSSHRVASIAASQMKFMRVLNNIRPARPSKVPFAVSLLARSAPR